MLSVKCENCQREFGTPIHSVGRIEYTRCKNVFRVAYRFRTPCPHCRHILQLSPHGKNEAIGVALSLPKNEVTERLSVASPEIFDVPTDRAAIGPDATLPRESIVANGRIPTVRVTKVQKSPPPKKERFRLIDQPLAFPKAIHVALKGERKKSFPWIKFALGLVIFLGTSMTIGLTILALQSSRSRTAPSVPEKKPALTDKATIIPEIPPLPQGGPENDSEIAEELNSKTHLHTAQRPIAKKNDPLSDLRLPRIDRLTSTFGERVDPFKNRESFHGGIDIAGEKRSEIKAALDGKVKFVGYRGGYGNVVVLSHGDGYETLYGHLEKPLVREGDILKRGDLLGLLGSTGRSTGPHVHFELHKNGKKIDPLRAELLARKTS